MIAGRAEARGDACKRRPDEERGNEEHGRIERQEAPIVAVGPGGRERSVCAARRGAATRMQADRQDDAERDLERPSQAARPKSRSIRSAS